MMEQGFNRESLIATFRNVALRKSLSFAPDITDDPYSEIGGSTELPNRDLQLFPLRDIWVMKEDQVLRSQSMRKSISRSLNNSKRESKMVDSRRNSVKSQSSIKRLVRSQVMYRIASNNSAELEEHGQLCIIHPQAPLRFAWDLLGIFMIGYDIVMIPMQLMSLGESWWDVFMSWVASIYWTADIFWSLRTGIYIGGHLEMRGSRIARRYLRTWFALDLLIVVPEWFSLISGSGSAIGDTMKGFRALRSLRFLRLLRLVKVERIIKDLEARINSNYFLLTIGIAKLISGLVIVNHLFACLWYGLGASTGNGWVSHAETEDQPLAYRYLTSMHWSLTQFHGTMEIYPRNLPERAFSVAVVLIALILFSSFLSSITNLMIQLQSLRSESVRQNRVLRTYLQQHQISQQLSVRVKKFIVGRTLQRQERDDEVELLRLLPEELLMDLHEETRAPALAYHVFFCEFRAVHRRASRQLYHHVLAEIIVIPNEVVFSDGDVCYRMLFVESGTYKYRFFIERGSDLLDSVETNEMAEGLQVVGSNTRSSQGSSFRGEGSAETGLAQQSLRSKAVQVIKGEWVSEAVLWTTWENTGELLCSLEGNLLALPAQEFGEMIQTYPGAHFETAMYARAFIQTLHDCDDPSDLIEPPAGWDMGKVEPEAIMRNVSYAPDSSPHSSRDSFDRQDGGNSDSSSGNQVRDSGTVNEP